MKVISSSSRRFIPAQLNLRTSLTQSLITG